MKRLALFLLALLLLFCLAACGEDPTPDNNTPTQSGDGDGTSVLSPYQVTKEQWEAAFEWGEDGEVLLNALSNHTCYFGDRAVLYKQAPEKNLYYRQSLDNASEYFYFRKGDKVDCYSRFEWGCYLNPDEDWERHYLNATTPNFERHLGYFALAYNYDEAVYSEDEKAYTYSGSSSEVVVYFENGKLIGLTLRNFDGEFQYTHFGTTEIVLPTEYEVRDY